MRYQRIQDAWASWMSPSGDVADDDLDDLTAAELSISIRLLVQALVVRRATSALDFNVVASFVRESVRDVDLPPDVPRIVTELVFRWAVAIDPGEQLPLLPASRVDSAALWVLEVELKRFFEGIGADAEFKSECNVVIQHARNLLAAFVSSGTATGVDP